jgi:NAD(P)-dependent dehydrogenase (short-subunit alcohol dehydrogenase family)
MDSSRLANRVAIVTGAARGIGRAIALRFAAEGAAVAVGDIRLDGAEAVAQEIAAAGGRALACEADVTCSAAVDAMVETVLGCFGQIDILVNNAGGGAALLGKTSAFCDMAEETWKWVIDLNLHGTMICAQAVLGHMIERRYGKIINLGSIAGVCGLPHWTAYAAAKGAIIAFTTSLATEAGEYGINVNCLSPGAILCEGPRDWTHGTWLRRGGEPEEVAALAAFLASDEAAYITGANYMIDGGRTLGPLR